jgi:alkylation response protein AidB-like acyl-CoA dehydrogenase
VLDGRKIICLAISDENAGSDVAGLTCTAKLSDCGKFYVVNGTKKWITNGTFADYFVTAVRTGDPGILGISMLLIERSEGGVVLF